MIRSRVFPLIALLPLAATLAGCPPKDPDIPCPPCVYKVSNGKLTGRMNGEFPQPYPYKNLVVTLKTGDGVLHPIPVGSPSTFEADQDFQSTVTSSITSNVVLVSATWKDADGNSVNQDNIPRE